MLLCSICRGSAREKGLDEFLQHVKQQASPVIGRQIDCVLQHWHNLDAGKGGTEEVGDDDQLDDLDDDLHDDHSHVGYGADEAETVHSWGTAAMQPLNACTLSCFMLHVCQRFALTG